MLIFGHKLIKTNEFVKFNADFEKNIKNEKIICLDYDEKILEKLICKTKNLAIFVKNADEALICNALECKFILCDNEVLAKKLSKIAEFYLFDSKILLIVNTLNNLENAYKLGVDGVILKSFIKES